MHTTAAVIPNLIWDPIDIEFIMDRVPAYAGMTRGLTLG